MGGLFCKAVRVGFESILSGLTELGLGLVAAVVAFRAPQASLPQAAGCHCLVLGAGAGEVSSVQRPTPHDCAPDRVSLHLVWAATAPACYSMPGLYELRQALCLRVAKPCPVPVGSWLADPCPSPTDRRPLFGIMQGPRPRTHSCCSPKGEESFHVLLWATEHLARALGPTG